MALRTQNPPSLFLEQWLRNSSETSPKQLRNTSAQSIVQAWSHLRDSLHRPSIQPHLIHQPLLILYNSIPTLHVAEPQAKLLLSLLSSLPDPTSAPLPLLLRLLYVWTRKSSKPSLSLLDSSFPILSRILTVDASVEESFVSEGVLLLGAISAVPGLSGSSRKVCCDLLCRLLEENRRAIRSHPELVPEVLAGIGYALVRSEIVYFSRILGSLLGFWRDGPCPCVPHGAMLLQLTEWLVSGFLSLRSLEKIEIVCREISEFQERNYVDFAVVMAAAGALRAFNRAASPEINPQLRNSVESTISDLAGDLISKTGNLCDFSGNFDQRLLLQCISLGLGRCGPILFRAPLLLCLSLGLLIEIFPLRSFYRRVIENPDGNSSILGLDEVKEHVGSVLFKEAGAVTGAFCDQYVLADEENKLVVENYVWSYCHESYLKSRLATMVLRGERNELLVELEKIAEAAFLMVVIFVSAVAKHKVNSNFSPEIQSETSVRILVAFSCVEYLRRVRLPEYSDTIRRVVLSVQEHASACASFVELMPSYADLTVQQGLRGMEYIWYKDDVQTARILFYLRVIPTCIERVPHHVFRKTATPTMFLYMQHPSGKVARASHSVFVAFISSGKDNQADKILLKEQLVFYYMQRALEAYPGITPIEGMAAGVAAIVRHLPAGSPSIFYCIHSLVEKVTGLCSKAMTNDADMWKNWKGDSEPCKKILELLLRLISLVDIQVLPDLLKLLAQLIVQLPKDGQNMVLDEIYSQVAESDDVTRKPILVSWVQSLSYLCSQKVAPSGKNQSTSSSTVIESSGEQNNGPAYNILNLYRTSSRL
ncbi:uncharacterized protein LOC131248431 [Magnolia sinica]|uniref:uncharacterized protein LOC131248431 n=1 Tax=Magnolia sinica TaxID=86752 RepID=UPI0026597AB3|nr:uncharacterized protein LOC131248431 [Magnolia sinica]